MHAPIYKLVHGTWKELPYERGNVGIHDPKLKEGYLGDLEKKSVLQLEELLARQEKILRNKSFVSKLKDGGEMLKKRHQEIATALELAHIRERNKGGADPLPDMNAVEWQNGKDGTSDDHNTHFTEDPLDSDDDDNADPLLLMANHSGHASGRLPCNVVENRYQPEVDPAAQLQKELEKLELPDSDESKTKLGMPVKVEVTSSQDFGSKILRTLEEKYRSNSHIREPFKPFRLPNNSVKEKISKNRNPPLWEESSATGPLKTCSNKPAVLLSLNESLTHFKEAQEKEKERQLEAAALKLSGTTGIRIGVPQFNTKSYRDCNMETHILQGDNSEESDSELGGLIGSESDDEGVLK